MIYKFNCDNCGVDSDYSSKPKVHIDEDRVEENKKKKKAYEARLKAKKTKEKRFKQKKKSFLGQYNYYRKEYKKWDERCFIQKLFGSKPSHENYSFDFFMSVKYTGLWKRKRKIEREETDVGRPLFFWPMGLQAVRYLICPVCKSRKYLKDCKWE
jgi:hypothetical protein